MTTIATLPNAWCVYSVEVPWHKGLFYVGLCQLADVTNLRDARNNSEFFSHVRPGDMIVVTVLAIMDDQREAAAVQAGMMAAEPYCNIKGTTVEPLTRVRCIETGVIYDSAAHAARSFNVTPQAMSQHLKRKPGSNSKVKGATFERVK